MDERESGITTRQMQSAPKGALFVWVNGNLWYPKRLAEHVDRTDLIIASPSQLDSSRFRGLTFGGVVVDHRAKLSGQQLCEVFVLRDACRVRAMR